MSTKLTPIILLVLTTIVFTTKVLWPASPTAGQAAPGLVAATKVSATPSPAAPAVDDFRISLDGVTAHAYDLEPLVENDATRARLMVAGIVGRPLGP
jgi:hypothetical protein